MLVAIKHLGVTTVSENHILFSIRRGIRFNTVQLNKIYKTDQFKPKLF